jgi:hypothetical protein
MAKILSLAVVIQAEKSLFIKIKEDKRPAF